MKTRTRAIIMTVYLMLRYGRRGAHERIVKQYEETLAIFNKLKAENLRLREEQSILTKELESKTC